MNSQRPWLDVDPVRYLGREGVGYDLRPKLSETFCLPRELPLDALCRYLNEDGVEAKVEEVFLSREETIHTVIDEDAAGRMHMLPRSYSCKDTRALVQKVERALPIWRLFHPYRFLAFEFPGIPMMLYSATSSVNPTLFGNPDPLLLPALNRACADVSSAIFTVSDYVDAMEGLYCEFKQKHPESRAGFRIMYTGGLMRLMHPYAAVKDRDNTMGFLHKDTAREYSGFAASSDLFRKS